MRGQGETGDGPGGACVSVSIEAYIKGCKEPDFPTLSYKTHIRATSACVAGPACTRVAHRARAPAAARRNILARQLSVSVQAEESCRGVEARVEHPQEEA